MSTFCRKLESPITNTEKLKQELEQKSTKVFSNGLCKCTKIKAQFKIKDNVQPILYTKSKTSLSRLKSK